MPLFDAVVFDLDGTLINTEQVWDDVRRQLAAEDGVPWPDTASHDMMGMSTQEWTNYLIDTVHLHGTPDDAGRRTIEAMLAAYHDHLEIQPDAVQTVRRMAALVDDGTIARGLGVASSSPRVLIEAALMELGVAELFPVIVSTEEVGAGKPAPDGYLLACDRLGADPTRSVAIEDSSKGIRSALAAGMTVIALPQPFEPVPDDVLDRCDAVVHHLSMIDAGLLRELATQASQVSR